MSFRKYVPTGASQDKALEGSVFGRVTEESIQLVFADVILTPSFPFGHEFLGAFEAGYFASRLGSLEKALVDHDLAEELEGAVIQKGDHTVCVDDVARGLVY